MERLSLGQIIRNFREFFRDIRPEWSKCNFAFEFLLEHLTDTIDGFNELVTLIERSDKSGRVGFDKHAYF